MTDHATTILNAIEDLRRWNGNTEAYRTGIDSTHALAAERDRWKRAALAEPQTREYEDAWGALIEHGDHTPD